MPLDVSVFGPIKTFYSQARENFMINHPGCVISEANIPFLFGETYIKGANMQNAINGFKACVIESFNSNIFQGNNVSVVAIICFLFMYYFCINIFVLFVNYKSIHICFTYT